MFEDVICLSHLRWGFVFQRPNHLMTRYAKSRRVFFVEEPICDAETPRLDVTIVDERLHVVVPHLPPGLPAERVEEEEQRLVQELAERARVRDPLLWFYTPMAVGHAARLRASGIVYDCMDELSHFHGAPPALRSREQQLFSISDVVFTGGHSLYEAKRDHHPRVHAFPSSVDAAHFAKARGSIVEPEDQRAIAHPRLGFFGVIDERMDLALVEALARRRPDHQLVFVGPVVKIDPARLPKLPNIHWLGQRRYEELPAYIAGWDVAIMPFARRDATKFISPTKTLEYLAAGKPVVSTSIRDVVRFYGEDGLVRIADEPFAFAAAVDAALAEHATEAATARLLACEAMLARTSWDTTWAQMHEIVEEALRAKSRASMRPADVPSSARAPASSSG